MLPRISPIFPLLLLVLLISVKVDAAAAETGDGDGGPSPFYIACTSCTGGGGGGGGGRFCTYNAQCNATVCDPNQGVEIVDANYCPSDRCETIASPSAGGSVCQACGQNGCVWCPNSQKCVYEAAYNNSPLSASSCLCPTMNSNDCVNCPSFSNCGSCMENDRCGWCSLSNQCVDINPSNSVAPCGDGLNANCSISPPPLTNILRTTSSTPSTCFLGVYNFIDPSSGSESKEQEASANLHCPSIDRCDLYSVGSLFTNGSSSSSACSLCTTAGCNFCQSTGKCFEAAPVDPPNMKSIQRNGTGFSPTCASSTDALCPIGCSVTTPLMCPIVTDCSQFRTPASCLDAHCSYCLSTEQCFSLTFPTSLVTCSVDTFDNATTLANDTATTTPSSSINTTVTRVIPITCPGPDYDTTSLGIRNTGSDNACLLTPPDSVAFVYTSDTHHPRCDSFSTCRSCTEQLHCAWCGSSNRCAYISTDGVNVCSQAGCSNPSTVLVLQSQCPTRPGWNKGIAAIVVVGIVVILLGSVAGVFFLRRKRRVELLSPQQQEQATTTSTQNEEENASGGEASQNLGRDNDDSDPYSL